MDAVNTSFKKAPKSLGMKAQMAAAIIGNSMEWYDFMVFAFMTPIISKLFFPSGIGGDPLNAILLTTALFGAGFVMRPLGGVILGIYADRKGRKAAMTLGMALMMVSVLLVTFTPTYHTAGLFAPLIVLVSRFLQGFSVGGEFGTSTSFLIELSPKGKTGFFGSWQIAGQLLALVVGASIGMVLTLVCTHEQIVAGAWRIPFAFGLLIVPTTLYMRLKLTEPEAFRSSKDKSVLWAADEDLMLTLRKYLVGMGMVAASAVSFYVTFGYTVTYAKVVLKLPVTESFMVQMIAAIVMVIVVPIAGAASDRFNRRGLLLASLIGYIVVLYPLYSWVTSAPSIERLLISQIIAGIFSATFLGVYCTTLVELYAVRMRAMSLGIVNNVAVVIFGGFSQFFVTFLLKLTSSPMAPVFYVIFCLLIGLISVVFMPDLQRLTKTDKPQV